MVLVFSQAEKQLYDSVIFPSFNLAIRSGVITALHSNVNIRQQLMAILTGKTSLSAGEISVSGKVFSKETPGIGLFFLETGFYERLTVQETLRFYQQLYNSTESTERIIKLVQLDSRRRVKAVKLTHSEKKRLQMACLLLQNPEVYNIGGTGSESGQ